MYVVKTNNLPSTNITQNPNVTNPNNVYYGDFSKTVALVMTNDALATVSFVHPTVEAKWFFEHLGTLLTIRVSQGMGFLRLECAVEISSDTASESSGSDSDPESGT